MEHVKYIKRAMALARKSSGFTSPNPMVGAVLVKRGRIIAEDYHRAPGTPHAEALVLEHAGRKAEGASLYVNLEPCCHTDKRTPPCTGVIIRAGVKRVFVAMKDPNPKVSGEGIRELRRAGVAVDCGILEEEAGKLNEAYCKYITQGIPFVTLKVAMTLDGKIALPSGESRWITGERSRRLVHHMRSSVDAVLTAIGTVRADNPELTARIRGGKDPKRIVIDPSLEIPDGYKILDVPPETIIVTERNAGDGRIEELSDKGVKFIFYRGTLHLGRLMERLGVMGITSLMIEGGSSLTSHALRDGVVDKVVFFISPKIAGGKDSYPAVGGESCGTLKDAYRIEDIKVKRRGEDIIIEGYTERRHSE